MATPTVIRFRLRSATPEERIDVEIPPPNISEIPPPRPLCNKIVAIRSKLVITRRIEAIINKIFKVIPLVDQ